MGGGGLGGKPRPGAPAACMGAALLDLIWTVTLLICEVIVSNGELLFRPTNKRRPGSASQRRPPSVPSTRRGRVRTREDEEKKAQRGIWRERMKF